MATTTLTGTVGASLDLTGIKSDSQLSGVAATNRISTLRTLLTVTTGKIFYIADTVASSSNKDYDLQTLTDIYGTALAFTSINMILLINKNSTSGKIQFPNGATPPTNPWGAPFLDSTTKNIELDAGGSVLLCNPQSSYPVTGSTKILRIYQSFGATAVTYDLFIVGNPS